MTNVFTLSEQKLTDLLNISNLPPKLFDHTRLTYGAPQAVAGSGYDTQVVATGIPGKGYYGDQTISYSRIDLSVLASKVSLFDVNPFTVDSIVSMINAQYATFLETSDLVPPSIPTLTQGGASGTVTLTADTSSIGWKGTVDITITYGKPPLTSVIGSKMLSTLKWADYPYRNGLEMLWKIDFTSFRDALAVKYYQANPIYLSFNGFTDYEKISDICIKLGIPWFPGPGWNQQVSDHATSEVPGSNTAFDRVVVMAPVQAGFFRTYDGALYFHYNNFDKA